MNCPAVLWYRTSAACLIRLRGSVVALAILTIWSAANAFAQNPSEPSNATKPLSIRATHLLGFEGTPSNANGTLSIQDDTLQFQKDGKLPIQIKIATIQDVFSGEESRQVGGTAMTLGKAAAPFGGGRVVSLFAHKNYDTFALEYLDANGGVHGAIFQLNKGQAQVLKSELVAKGAHISHSDDAPKNQSTTEEVPHERK
jgi:hypothetical protein